MQGLGTHPGRERVAMQQEAAAQQVAQQGLTENNYFIPNPMKKKFDVAAGMQAAQAQMGLVDRHKFADAKEQEALAEAEKARSQKAILEQAAMYSGLNTPQQGLI